MSIAHDSNEYLKRVRHYINIGHIHTHTTNGRIIAQGSFDRLAHNEEEPKGAVECVIRKDGNNAFYFIENKSATLFKTYTLKNRDIDASIRYLDKKISALPINSHIRIRAYKDHPAMVAFDTLKRQWPLYYLTKIAIEDDRRSDVIKEIILEESAYVPITLTSDNLRSMMTEAITSKNDLTPQQWEVADRIFDDVL